MRSFIAATLFALVALLATAGSAKDWIKALGSGEILVYTRPKKGSDVPEMVVKAVINAPPAKVWQLVSDCNRYAGIMPRVKAAKLISRKGDKYTCKITVDMPFPYSDTTSVTEGIHTASEGLYSRRWRLLRGDYTHNSGAWVLKPFNGDKKRTLVHYRVHAVPKAWVPLWIRNKAQKRTLPKLINRIRMVLR